VRGAQYGAPLTAAGVSLFKPPTVAYAAADTVELTGCAVSKCRLRRPASTSAAPDFCLTHDDASFAELFSRMCAGVGVLARRSVRGATFGARALSVDVTNIECVKHTPRPHLHLLRCHC